MKINNVSTPITNELADQSKHLISGCTEKFVLKFRLCQDATAPNIFIRSWLYINLNPKKVVLLCNVTKGINISINISFRMKIKKLTDTTLLNIIVFKCFNQTPDFKHSLLPKYFTLECCGFICSW